MFLNCSVQTATLESTAEQLLGHIGRILPVVGLQAGKLNPQITMLRNAVQKVKEST